MRIFAAVLLDLGVFLCLVAPHWWGDFISGAGVRLPQFVWSKSPPHTLYLSATALLRLIGILLIAIAALCFILFRGSDGK